MINLSKLVGKLVVFTLRNGDEGMKVVELTEFAEGFDKSVHLTNPYTLKGHSFSYRADGLRFENQTTDWDIVFVAEVSANPDPTFELPDVDSKAQDKPAKLSFAAMSGIAAALLPEAIDYIELNEKYAELMVELIGQFMQERLGIMDDGLRGELSFMIMDLFRISPTKS